MSVVALGTLAWCGATETRSRWSVDPPCNMWGQLSSLGQVLKESAETVAREAGLDQQLVSLDVIGTDISIRLCLSFPRRAYVLQDQARNQVGSQLGSLLAYEGQSKKSPSKQVLSHALLTHHALDLSTL